MADEELVAELADIIRADHWWECDHSHPDGWPGCAEDRAQAVLAWLAERGRLVDGGAQVGEQWATEVTVNGESAYWPGPREQAQHYASQHPAARFVRRQVITGPWVAVDEEPDADLRAMRGHAASGPRDESGKFVKGGEAG